MSNIGFPIALVFYLLLRFEKILKENTGAVKELHQVWRAHYLSSIKPSKVTI